MLVDPRSAVRADAEYQRYLDSREESLARKLVPILTAAINIQVSTSGERAESYLIERGTPVLRKHIERVYREQYVSVSADLERRSLPFETLITKQTLRQFLVESFMEEVSGAISRYAATEIRRIADSLKARIRDIIFAKVREGKSNTVIAKEIRAAAPREISRPRAATIARTETHNASLAAIEATLAYKKIEVRRKQWWSAHDNRVRDTHKDPSVDGVSIPYDEAFTVGAYKMMRPGDASLGAGPEEIINCRCSLLFLTGVPAAPTEKTSSAAELYRAPTKTPEQIVAQYGAADAIKKVEAKLKQLVHTDAPVAEGGFKLPDDTYTTQRAALHQKIVDDILTPQAVLRATPVTGAPTLTILGGRGGSGKSWITTPGKGPVDASKSILVDADHIKSLLPEYKGWNAAQVHEESSHIVNLIHRRASSLGVNVIHDATLKSLDSAEERIANYDSKGYQLEGYYMYLSPDDAASRALSRYAKGGTFTGRYVPPKIILGNTDNEKNFDTLSKRFVRWKVYENSGKSPRLVEESG